MSNYDLKTNIIKRRDKCAEIIQTPSPSVSSYICFISPRRFHLSWVVHETLLWLSSTFHMSSFHNRLMEFSTFFRKKQHTTDIFFSVFILSTYNFFFFSVFHRELMMRCNWMFHVWGKDWLSAFGPSCSFHQVVTE